MTENSVALGYAQALYEIASAREISDQVGTELQSLTALIKGNKDLEKILYHPTISDEKKKSLLSSLLAGDSSALFNNFLFLLIDKRREKLLSVLESSYLSITRAFKGIVVAEVQSTVKMTDANLVALKSTLEKLMSKEVEFETVINPKILGGLVIRIGDKLIDGSVRSKLMNLKKKLMQTVPA